MREALGALVHRFADRSVLVLGDMVADEYVMGRPARISREAPVLILHYANSFVRPGGATNTAYNLSSLGARTSVIGVIGDDEMGRKLVDALSTAGIDGSGLLVDTDRPTSTKTRVVAKGSQEVQQQIVRIDRVDTSNLSEPLRNSMIDTIRGRLSEFDALLISDYENGVISPELIEACLPAARVAGLKVVVDSHGDLFRFKGVTAATPNQPEAAASLHVEITNDDELDDAGARLLQGMEAEGILITRGSEGMALFERGRPPFKLPVTVDFESQVVDPTGAGDTVAAVFTLCVTSGASMQHAAFLGNVAGGEVVRRLGAATLTADQLHRALSAGRSTGSGG
jgi:rfaE bifunctional protein kinase chain/domain